MATFGRAAHGFLEGVGKGPKERKRDDRGFAEGICDSDPCVAGLHLQGEGQTLSARPSMQIYVDSCQQQSPTGLSGGFLGHGSAYPAHHPRVDSDTRSAMSGQGRKSPPRDIKAPLSPQSVLPRRHTSCFAGSDFLREMQRLTTADSSAGTSSTDSVSSHVPGAHDSYLSSASTTASTPRSSSGMQRPHAPKLRGTRPKTLLKVATDGASLQLCDEAHAEVDRARATSRSSMAMTTLVSRIPAGDEDPTSDSGAPGPPQRREIVSPTSRRGRRRSDGTITPISSPLWVDTPLEDNFFSDAARRLPPTRGKFFGSTSACASPTACRSPIACRSPTLSEGRAAARESLWGTHSHSVPPMPSFGRRAKAQSVLADRFEMDVPTAADRLNTAALHDPNPSDTTHGPSEPAPSSETELPTSFGCLRPSARNAEGTLSRLDSLGRLGNFERMCSFDRAGSGFTSVSSARHSDDTDV